jgi:hypothetical protein
VVVVVVPIAALDPLTLRSPPYPENPATPISAAARVMPQRPTTSVALVIGRCVMPRARLPPPTGLDTYRRGHPLGLMYDADADPPERLTRDFSRCPGGSAGWSRCCRAVAVLLTCRGRTTVVVRRARSLVVHVLWHTTAGGVGG